MGGANRPKNNRPPVGPTAAASPVAPVPQVSPQPGASAENPASRLGEDNSESRAPARAAMPPAMGAANPWNAANSSMSAGAIAL